MGNEIKKIFITGGSGFVGGQTIRMLKDRYEILAVARSTMAADKIKPMNVEILMKDLNDIQETDFTGVDAVIHIAALATDFAKRDDYYNANVMGTKVLIEASKKAGVKRFVYMSSTSTIQTFTEQFNINENVPYPNQGNYYYGATKQEAEKLVLSANDDSFVTVSLRPHFVWGVGDNNVLPSLIRMIDQGSFMWINHGQYKVATVNVKNLVHSIELSLEKDCGGEAFFISDSETMTLNQFLRGIAASSGRKIGNRSVAPFIARNMAIVLEGIWRIMKLRGVPPISVFAAKLMSSNLTMDISKAKKVLDYRPVISWEEGLGELVESMKA